MSTLDEFESWLRLELESANHRDTPRAARLADRIANDGCSEEKEIFDLGRQYQYLQVPSVVLGLVKAVYNGHPPRGKYVGGARSWRRLNDGLHTVLAVAITTSLPFELADFADIFKQCSGHYWFGHGRGSGEGFYRLAVEHQHLSACRSFEHWKGRKPFMWRGKRLAVASVFQWDGHEVTVTSFADDGFSLTACRYRSGTTRTRKPVRRYSITHRQLQAAQRKAKP